MALPHILDASGELVVKPLEVTPDPEKMTVGDARLMKGYMNLDDGAEAVALVGEFLIKHTNWTEAEVNRLTMLELRDVLKGLRKAEETRAVPLEN